MPEYLAPGVYVEEIDTGSKPIEGVSTSTAGMVGVTERGPVNVPILITSFGEYQRWFGDRLNPTDFGSHCYLPHAVEGFFLNGGKRVFITRILDLAGAAHAMFTLHDRGTPPFGSTVLLRAVRPNTGTVAQPPLLVALSGANLQQNDSIRVGDGSNSEYRQIAVPLAAETVLIPLNFPLSRSHATPGPIDVEQFTPAAPVATFTIVSASQRADQIIEINGTAANIAALAVDVLLEIGANANVSEHRFIRQVTFPSATNARALLDSPLKMPYDASTPVRQLNLGAGPPTAQLDPDAGTGESLIFVNNRGGNFDVRTDLIVINSGNTATREVRRIGELRQVTISTPVIETYSTDTLVEGVLLNNGIANLTAASGAGTNTLTISDVTALSIGQTLQVGPAAGPLETVVIQSINPVTRVVTLAANLVAAKAIGDLVAPVRTLTAMAAAGASLIALNNRMGLQVGDSLRIGAIPEDEYAIITGLPSRAAPGVGPDAGNVILARPLGRDHPVASTPVVRQNPVGVAAVQPTVLSLAVQAGEDEMLLSDGNGYAVGTFLRLSTTAGVFFHRVAAITPAPGNPGSLAPQMITLNAPLNFAHPAGSLVAERRPLLDVWALDPGAWGNRLRISVEGEPAGLVARTTLNQFGPMTSIRLGSPAGVEPGTILEFMDANGNPIAPPQKVSSINQATGEITLAGPGLSGPQQVVGLDVRSREFSLTVRLLRQPDPALPSRNETVIDLEAFRYLSLDPNHSRYIHNIIGTTWTPGNPNDDDGNPLRRSDRRSEGESAYIRVRDTAQALPEPARTNTLESIRLGPETLIDILPSGQRRLARHRLDGGGDSIATLIDTVHYRGVDAPNPENRTGLYSLRNIEEISIIAAPGRTSAQLQGDLISQCESMRYRFAVLDGPRPPTDTLSDVQFQRQQLDTKYAALYHPWLLIPDPYPVNPAQIAEYPVPPSGHILGVYARTDIDRGVHKAPANEVVRGVIGLRRLLNKEQHDILNPYPVNINVIRDFRSNNRGIRVYGGRCITSDPDWKYVNVRRLLIFIEASIDRGLQWVVFEPNAEPLWARVRRTISNFLTTVWRNGALEGTTREEAYFVKCDRTTMTQADIDNGRLICVIGVAPVKPAEFVIIRIGLWTAHAED